MSLSLTTPNENDYRNFARNLARTCAEYGSYERVSQCIAQALYQEFTNNGEPELALVRLFRLCQAAKLPADLKNLLSSDERFAMILTGTYGQEAAWCDRHHSVNHRVIAINDIAIPSRIPMFEAILVGGMQVDFKRLYQTGDVVAATQGLAGMFHVPDVSKSPQHIPAQDEFVAPYGIRSEIGFGGLIMGDSEEAAFSLYTLFAFSRVPVSDEAAQCFYTMRSDIGTALSAKSGEIIFEQ